MADWLSHIVRIGSPKPGLMLFISRLSQIPSLAVTDEVMNFASAVDSETDVSCLLLQATGPP